MKRRPPVINGILLVDKPAGWTSHDVVARVRRLTGERRIGHTGTLDPAATGLLVLCLGRATRFVEYMTLHDKRYEGVIRLGTTTTTDDAEGETVESGSPPQLTSGLLETIVAQFTGRIRQRPPAFSAIKVAGKRAYALARAGEAVTLPEREVEIHRLRLSIESPDTLAATVHCGSGTYIRSLARDIGTAVGCPAHLASLRRISVAQFDVESAWTMEQLEQFASDGTIAEVILPPDEGLTAWPVAILSEPQALSIAQGKIVAVTLLGPAGEARLYTAAGEFGGTVRVEADGTVRARKLTPTGSNVMTRSESGTA